MRGAKSSQIMASLIAWPASPAAWVNYGSFMSLGAYWLAKWRYTKQTEREAQPERSMVLHGALALTLNAMFVRAPLNMLNQRFIEPNSLTSAASIVCSVSGAVLAVWSRRVLADNWDPKPALKKDHQLVQHGPYALMRHPIYTSLLLLSLGGALATCELKNLLWVVCVPGFIDKAMCEESLLRGAFPEYAAYASRVNRFIPFLP